MQVLHDVSRRPGAVTGGINLAAGDAEICELGFTPRLCRVSVERMAALRLAPLESSRGNLPNLAAVSSRQHHDLLAACRYMLWIHGCWWR